jgi:hypothetical protein
MLISRFGVTKSPFLAQRAREKWGTRTSNGKINIKSDGQSLPLRQAQGRL